MAEKERKIKEAETNGERKKVALEKVLGYLRALAVAEFVCSAL